MKAAKGLSIFGFLLFIATAHAQVQGLTDRMSEAVIFDQEKEFGKYSWYQPYLQNYFHFSTLAYTAQSEVTSSNLISTPHFISLPDPSPTSFFCRMERRLEEHTGWPVRFRLGSLEYTNRLEGK